MLGYRRSAALVVAVAGVISLIFALCLFSAALVFWQPLLIRRPIYYAGLTIFTISATVPIAIHSAHIARLAMIYFFGSRR